MKKTLVVGASPHAHRYAYMATVRLQHAGHETLPIGVRKGEINDQEIIDLKEKPQITGIDTITLYINPLWQEEWGPYLLSLNPKRIIFNPGTENPVLAKEAKAQGIEVEFACTLVMLSAGTY